MNGRLLATAVGIATVVAMGAVAAPTTKAVGWFKQHTVKKGESVTAIAKQYYGEIWKYVYIKTANRIVDESKVAPGTKLRIPDVIMHTVQSGDSYSKLSLKYFGNKEFFELILWANRKQSMEAMQPGDTVLIPHILKHPVKAGDRLDDIAETYYHDKAMAPLLKQWNHLKQTSLVGVQSVWLPLREGIVPKSAETPAPTPTPTSVSKSTTGKSAPSSKAQPTATPTAVPTAIPTPVIELKPEPTATPVAEKPKESITVSPAFVPPQQATQSFDISSMVLAKEHLREGKYASALEIMQQIAPQSFKTPSQKSDYYWQLLLCYVALGDKRRAVKALDAYLNVGEEDLASLRGQLSQLSPKLRVVIEALAAQRKSPKEKPN